MSRGEVQSKSWRARLRKAVFAGAVAVVPPWAVGQAARDWSWLTGLCFYIPSAFVAACLLGWALAHLAGRRWRAAALAVCLSLPPLGVALLVENRPYASRPPTMPGQIRIVHWNVGGSLTRPGARNFLLAQRADLYVLSEVPSAGAVEDFREALGADYHSQVFGNLAVVASGQVRAGGWLLKRKRVKVQAVTWERSGRAVALLVVDLPSEIYIHRDPLLRELNGLIERRRPDLVVGDFNAPRRSRALCRLPAGYRHAYDTAGSGCGYTWPIPVPMYALDHCIHSSRIAPSRYELFSSVHSDHRMQVFDFSWPPGE